MTSKSIFYDGITNLFGPKLFSIKPAFPSWKLFIRSENMEEPRKIPSSFSLDFKDDARSKSFEREPANSLDYSKFFVNFLDTYIYELIYDDNYEIWYDFFIKFLSNLLKMLPLATSWLPLHSSNLLFKTYSCWLTSQILSKNYISLSDYL